ncbi:hypothetical protein NC653_022204 [Populus alba x Populus x berolinensis]|uniref:Uncharacterized protein n=1 Tax=Populus alba x Populus x berolinensis TaxID=444605 RepID=A0AAD6VUK2_9ROSI|nr:hypothetical protein NC653_022204 [Populus alba x Populus x berolinensis]
MQQASAIWVKLFITEQQRSPKFCVPRSNLVWSPDQRRH